jgi:hypothetical protein
MKAMGGNGKKKVLTLVGVAPWPQFPTKEEKPAVIYWLRELYQHSGAQNKGETDGNAVTITTKNNVGRPRKTTNKEELGIVGDTHKHIYLKKEDGTLISVPEL